MVRIDTDLRTRYRSMASLTGLIAALCGLLMLTPLLALPWWPEEARFAGGFIAPAVIVGVAGTALWRLCRVRPGPTLTVQDGGVFVLCAWVLVPLVSSAPFLIVLDASFTQAIFESVSGWTTTGLSVVDVETAPRTVLLWRSVMQLAGGAGIAIILTTVAGGVLGPGITTAEGRTDQLAAHVVRSARLVLTIYGGYALACTVALYAAGMSWFDAVNHAFAAVSTGGFSTRAASLGHWDSSRIEAMAIIFMVLGSTNFQTVHMALRGRHGSVLKNGEVTTAGLVVALAIPLLIASATGALYAGGGRQVRVAVFEVVTALTTTGFSTSEGAVYRGWPSAGIAVLILLMLIGGGTGSTAGGIKQHRVYLLACALWWEFKRLLLPTRAVFDTTVWQGDGRVTVGDRDVVRVAAFATAYVSILFLGTGVLVACGLGLQESLFEFASALGTVGLSVGVTGATAPAPVLWAEIVGMFLGRLEIFIVLVALRKLLADGAAVLRTVRR